MEGATEVLGVFADAAAAVFLEVLEPRQSFAGDAFGVMHEASRIGSRDHLSRPSSAELLDGVERDVAGTRHGGDSAGEVFPTRCEHVLKEIHRAVAGGFGAGMAAAEGQPLAGDDAAAEAVGEPQVLAKEISHLAPADADVAGRNVSVWPDVVVQFQHHGLAEAHHLVFALAVGVEVGAALGATHRQPGEAVLEDLLEAQELEDADGDAGVEAQAALVRADGVAELHPPSAVDAHVAGVVLPGDAEGDDAIRLGEPLHEFRALVLGMAGDERDDGFGHFAHRLMELRLAGIAPFEAGHESLDLVSIVRCHCVPPCAHSIRTGGEPTRKNAEGTGPSDRRGRLAPARLHGSRTRACRRPQGRQNAFPPEARHLLTRPSRDAPAGYAHHRQLSRHSCKEEPWQPTTTTACQRPCSSSGLGVWRCCRSAPWVPSSASGTSGAAFSCFTPARSSVPRWRCSALR